MNSEYNINCGLVLKLACKPVLVVNCGYKNFACDLLLPLNTDFFFFPRLYICGLMLFASSNIN